MGSDPVRGNTIQWTYDDGPMAGKRFESGMYRGLARRPAARRKLVAQFADRLVEHGRVIGVQDRLHGEYLGMPAERFHRAENHRLSADRTVLFWPSRAGPKAAPGGNKNGSGALGFRHCVRLPAILGLREGAKVGLAHCPYHAESGKPARLPIAVGK